MLFETARVCWGIALYLNKRRNRIRLADTQLGETSSVRCPYKFLKYKYILN